MITKGIVEEILSPTQIKVRIPLLHQSKDASMHTSTKELPTASICTLPSIMPNIKLGDIVWVSFEDRDSGKPIILGYLPIEKNGKTLTDIKTDSIVVNGSSSLGYDTKIGDVTSSEIQYLRGLRGNIQGQLDVLIDGGGGGGGQSHDLTPSELQEILNVFDT